MSEKIQEATVERKSEELDGSLRDPRVRNYLEYAQDPDAVETYLIARYEARRGDRDAQEIENEIFDKIAKRFEYDTIRREIEDLVSDYARSDTSLNLMDKHGKSFLGYTNRDIEDFRKEIAEAKQRIEKFCQSKKFEVPGSYTTEDISRWFRYDFMSALDKRYGFISDD